MRKDLVLFDYRIALLSREASLLGRREVLGGRAKFGIFGDGKELPQLALARAARPGDWRSGYYRDQTIMMAKGLLSVREFFAQLFADTELGHEPASGGRQMNSHFATRFLANDESWLPQLSSFQSSSDISPTGGQMARLLGLAYASKLYRFSPALSTWDGRKLFSAEGNEVAFGTIGNASTSEGVFWETLNAAAVLQVPMVLSVWDDGYGISVPAKFQTAKGSISAITKGFHQSHEAEAGALSVYEVCGYDYPALLEVYSQATEATRRSQRPCLIHVKDLTQPQGHSTSGSHERYKSKERLAYEASIDGLLKMREWILSEGLSDEKALVALEKDCADLVLREKNEAWAQFQRPIQEARRRALLLLEKYELPQITKELSAREDLLYKDVHRALTSALLELREKPFAEKAPLIEALEASAKLMHEKVSSKLYAEQRSPLAVTPKAARYAAAAERVDGRQIIQRYFDLKLAQDPRLFIVGEDVGQLGGVNLEFDGLQDKHGDLRVTDTGIREATILGQAIGAAMRGLRPIADIQYLDYLLYALQTLSDDLATLRYRSSGGQAAPVIVRTKGHRLEGIWHTGSPIGMLLGSIRGVHLCVPRNCVQAAGLYETLLQGDDPAVVIEVLNGYRLKEAVPENLGVYTVPLGVCETLREGKDITLATYGASVAIALSAAEELAKIGIELEVIDVQTLLPFDLSGSISQSLRKTGALLLLDEDYSGAATGYMLQEVLEKQGGYELLDAAPRTLAAKPHRSAYGSDGDYFSKPQVADLVQLAYEMQRERHPELFPALL